MLDIGIIVAAGMGKRMGTKVKKQFLEIKGKPILYYAAKAMQDSFIDKIIIVTSAEDIEFVSKNIVKKYHLDKVCDIIEGGENRYDSVYNGLKLAGKLGAGYVYIHDGARPMLSVEIMERNLKAVEKYGACVTGVYANNTLKTIDEEGFVDNTLDRSHIYEIQTPQSFEYKLISEAYEKMLKDDNRPEITDDSMVVELYTDKRVKSVLGDYKNIKVTTIGDINVIKGFLSD